MGVDAQNDGQRTVARGQHLVGVAQIAHIDVKSALKIGPLAPHDLNRSGHLALHEMIQASSPASSWPSTS